MARRRTELSSLRFSRLEKKRLIIALLVSLLAHFGAWGAYEVGKKTGVWHKLVHHRPPKPTPKLAQAHPTTIFVDVSQPSTTAPKQAKYYSDKNSRAANPETKVHSNKPKLEGQQRHVPKVNNTPPPSKPIPKPVVVPKPPVKPKPTPVKPAAKPTPVKPKPAPKFNPGILHPGKPSKPSKPKVTPKTQPHPKPPARKRPRTLREALQSRQLPGIAMRQNGGVKRHALKSSLDAIATPFGSYDRRIIAAIQSRWYALLASQQFAQDRTGKVMISFHLNPDGSVTEAKIVKNTVGDVLGYLCLESIQQSAPFGPWPSDMRRMIGANFREITFTFYYY